MTQHRNLPDDEPEYVMVPYADFNTLKFPDKDQIAEILDVPEVDCGVDAVGFEARGHGRAR